MLLNISMFPEVIYKFLAISIKILMAFKKGNSKTNSKPICNPPEK